MEHSTFRSQNLFKRMLLYHLYRQGKNYIEAYQHLYFNYGSTFIASETHVMKLYEYFNDWDKFNFDSFCSADLDQLVPSSFDQQSFNADNYLSSSIQPSTSTYQQSSQYYHQDLSIQNDATNHHPKASTSAVSHDTTLPAKPKSITQNGSTQTEEIYFDEELRKFIIDESNPEYVRFKRKIRRRQLIYRCFKAKYNRPQCKQFIDQHAPKLNDPDCETGISLSSISKWYKTFKDAGDEMPKFTDAHRSGKRPNINIEEIQQFFLDHGNECTPQQLTDHFKEQSKNVLRTLHELGYVRRFDRWVKGSQSDVAVSDEALFEYKFTHSDARAIDIGRHFDIVPHYIDSRLRAMGFHVPEYSDKVQGFKKRKRHRTDVYQTRNSSANGSSVNDSSSESSSDDDEDHLAPPLGMHPKGVNPGRPKGTRNIKYKGLFLFKGQPVSDMEEAKRIAFHNLAQLGTAIPNGTTSRKSLKQQQESNSSTLYHTISEDQMQFLNLLKTIQPIPKPQAQSSSTEILTTQIEPSDEMIEPVSSPEKPVIPIKRPQFKLQIITPNGVIPFEQKKKPPPNAKRIKALSKAVPGYRNFLLAPQFIPNSSESPTKSSDPPAAQSTATSDTDESIIIKADPSCAELFEAQATELPEDENQLTSTDAFSFDPLSNLDAMIMDDHDGNSTTIRSARQRRMDVVVCAKKIKEEY